MGDFEKYDTAFLGILQNEGTIVNFLDVVFGFLYRKTDFYQILNEQKTMGFPPGISAKLAFSAFKKFQEKAEEDRKIFEAKKKMLTPEAIPVIPPAAEVAAVEEVETSDEPTPAAPLQASQAVAGPADASTCQPAPPVEHPDQPMPAGQDGNKMEVEDSNDPDEDPELTMQQKIFQANADSYNGAIRDTYVWGQEIKEVNARVLIPQHIKRGKDCRVSIQRKHLKVEVKGAEPGSDWQVIVDNSLSWEVHKDESYWSLVNDRPRPDQPMQYNIHVNLEKVQERWWDALLTDEQKISVRKIDPSRPMTDLDDEAQAKLEEMMWNERRKQLGLPQSGQMKMEKTLRQAWDADGSPFKGQKFDMSKINISNDGSNINFN